MEPQLIIPPDWDDFIAFEVEHKGWFEGQIVVDGRELKVTFYDPDNLAIDVELDMNAGRDFIEHNLIVVRRVTMENMRRAVAALPSGIFEP